MAQAAVANGGRIGVLATLQTTLTPTADLIAAVARETGASCTVTSQLVEGAFETLQSGDRALLEAVLAVGDERIVRNTTVPNEIVLDPFAGSGNCGVAALKHGRRAVLIDVEMYGVYDTFKKEGLLDQLVYVKFEDTPDGLKRLEDSVLAAGV